MASKVSLYVNFLLCILSHAYRAAYACNKFSHLFFQMAALNFNWILLKLTSKGSIPRDTLHSQDGLNLGDICFCPIQCTLSMQRISLDYLWKLITEGTFMPSMVEGTLKLSGTTAILLVFQADDQHEKITDVYVGLIVCHIESHLYAPEQIFQLRV